MDVETLTVTALRKELSLTMEAFAGELGLRSKGQVSEIERTNTCSLPVALKIEELSGGRIPAASLNGDVALVDAARGGAVHTGSDTSIGAQDHG